MRILIANSDLVDDEYNLSLEDYVRDIRLHNQRSAGRIRFTDPYQESDPSQFDGVTDSFTFCRAGEYQGVMARYEAVGEPYICSRGFLVMSFRPTLEVNPLFLPFLTREVLVAYMPQIPWDDFGNHLFLEGDDAEQFLHLWERFLQEKKWLFNALFQGNYPVDSDNSRLGYIFMDNIIE